MKAEELNQLRTVSDRMARNGIESTENLWVAVPELQKISRSLSRLAESNCNGHWSYAEDGNEPCRQERRETFLLAQAENLARALGATFFHQSDPRGAAIYLVWPKDLPEGADIRSCYTNGVAIY